MKRFRFKLRAVLDHRKRIESARKRELAEAAREVVLRRQQLTRLDQQIRDGRHALAAESKGQIDSRRVLMHRRYLGHLALQVGHMHQELIRSERALDGHRDRLVAASRDRKVMEKLEDKQRRIHRHEADRAEQRTTDEIAQRRAEEPS